MIKLKFSWGVIGVLMYVVGIAGGQTSGGQKSGGQSATGQSNDVDDPQKLMAQVLQQHKVPGLVVAAVKADGVLAMGCLGVRKRGTDDAIELSDRHPIGSNTKSMTATLAAVLVDQGKIDWKTTVGQVWGENEKVTVHPKLADVTLNELLSHQSGLRRDLNLIGGLWASLFKEDNEPPAERQRLVKYVLAKKPAFKLGEYHYSNIGYVVAAAMLEQRAGADYETLMRRHVFGPLNMKTADFRTLKSVAKKTGANQNPMVWGHRANGDPIDPRIAGAENPSVYASCGTVNLTIADYVKYAQWHLNGKPGPLLKNKDTFDHLHAGQVKAPSVGGKYGSGWIIVNSNLGGAMSHAGSNTNCFAVIWVYPEKDFAALACCNTGEQSGYLACEKIIEKLTKRYAKK